jgi:hypothetical protein
VDAQGRTTPGDIITNVRGGGSYHNWGLAFNAASFENGVPSNDMYKHQKIGKPAVQVGLEWSGEKTSGILLICLVVKLMELCPDTFPDTKNKTPLFEGIHLLYLVPKTGIEPIRSFGPRDFKLFKVLFSLFFPFIQYAPKPIISRCGCCTLLMN